MVTAQTDRRRALLVRRFARRHVRNAALALIFALVSTQHWSWLIVTVGCATFIIVDQILAESYFKMSDQEFNECWERSWWHWFPLHETDPSEEESKR